VCGRVGTSLESDLEEQPAAAASESVQTSLAATREMPELVTMPTPLLHVAFVFAVLGSKLLIGLWIIYNILPADRRCSDCGAETLLVHQGLSRRQAGLLFLGKVQLRWCPECSATGFTRPIPRIARLLQEAREPDHADRTR
jgi:hypothetical protein